MNASAYNTADRQSTKIAIAIAFVLGSTWDTNAPLLLALIFESFRDYFIFQVD